MSQLYHLPFYADDLKPGERLYTSDHASGIQRFGYDVSGRRLKTNGSWTSVKADSNSSENRKNSDLVIYGKPVYAIADGEVIAGWRNAPENPRPKRAGEVGEGQNRLWLHQAFRDGLMPGGGNHLWVRHDDGVEVLYAHMKPGTIPAALCPHTKALFDRPHDGRGRPPETAIPSSNRVRVKKGQFLGRVGNSGKSSGPHLHFHAKKNRAAHLMRFARGLATPWNNGMADINSWERFAGEPIPNGAVLFWPPHKLHAEYARHGFPADQFQRMFTHLADSGYAPEWIDGYSVAGKTFFNFVWRPEKTNWRAFFGQSASDYQNRFNQAKADGLAPVHVESYLSAGKVRFAVIFKAISGQWLAHHHLTFDAHQAILDQAKADGFSPRNVSVTSKNGSRRYTVLYRKESIGAWQLKSRLTASAYQDAVDENKIQGRSPIYISAYMHQGEVHFATIFAEKPMGSWRARHGMDSAEYQSEWKDATTNGFITHVVTGYDGAQHHHRYAAVWRMF